MKIMLVVGARPNFMKIAPIIRAIKSFNQTNQTNLSRLPCNAVYGVKCDLPCGLWKLLHGEPISLGPNKPKKPKKPEKLNKPDKPKKRDRPDRRNQQDN